MPPVLDMLVRLLVASVLLGAASGAFTPADNYLVLCGTSASATVAAGRTFVGDARLPAKSLAAPQSVEANTSRTAVVPSGESELYRSARVFTAPASYTFAVKQPGRHFVRLHFFPFPYRSYDMVADAAFNVSVQGAVLVNGYTPKNGTAELREFSVNVTGGTLVIAFAPTGKLAFVNAIEVVSVPDELIADMARMVDGAVQYTGLSTQALETIHRINMGVPKITPGNDTLGRTWLPDQSFQVNTDLAQHKDAKPLTIKYDEKSALSSAYTAPAEVYATATRLSTAGETSTINVQFNISWRFDAPAGSDYLLRFHWCDIVSKAAMGMAFNVYVGGAVVLDNYEISRDTFNRLSIPVYKDFLLGAKDAKGAITVSIGSSTEDNALPDGFLNGLEIMSIVGSAGAGAAATSPRSSKVKIGIIAGSAVCGATLVMVLGFIAFKMLRGREPEKKKPADAWSPFSASALGSRSRSRSFSKSNGNTVLLGQNGAGAGYRIPFAALQEATGGFDEGMVIGEGGFGKVYKGTMRDETVVAVKRGNRRTQQGLHEFHTEIEMLSRLRHRHLVSLIGYCDERGEMILVYEYMAMGTLRSHLYGAGLPPLSWEQRLEACIGAARGLHYLHTGSAKAIIHRDVKSANILLDESFMAKVADFGLSKNGPELDKTHVSTKVKGSFGYLDPEYFRRQMLTEKSDVYSFGVVLLEALCARTVIDPTLPREMVSLAEWATPCLRNGQLDQIVDQRIAGTIRPGSLKKLADTAEKCLAEYGVERPTMGDVLWCLEFALQLQVGSSDSSDVDTMLPPAPPVPVKTPEVQRRLSAATVATDAAAMTTNLGDLDGMSLSGVFSNMIKSDEVR
ncbi:hypothetical protein CFC21_062057 [Triticum aestivum]|uniref:Protein kinase domain-containing protein n=2 Tax=Triticum aestivum TaxID=4565 RepID=A0A9R1GXA9_WHEAT|nr:hypothetical protein CFC21_062057 [Triticum aestivum]